MTTVYKNFELDDDESVTINVAVKNPDGSAKDISAATINCYIGNDDGIGATPQDVTGVITDGPNGLATVTVNRNILKAEDFGRTDWHYKVVATEGATDGQTTNKGIITVVGGPPES